MKLSIFLLLALLVCCNCKLQYLFSMMRHGALYPKNNLYDGNQTAMFRGQISPAGLRQQFNLGSYIKHNYITQQQLTTPKFAPSQAQFYASTYQRTQISSVSFIYGLYPLGEGWTIPEGISSDKLKPPFTSLFSKQLQQESNEEPFALNKGFQPLPVRPLDNILDNCPNYNVLMDRRKAQIAAQVTIFQRKHSLEISKMKVLFNLTNEQATVTVMSDLYETLEADRYLGRPLPSQYNENDDIYLKYIYEYYNTLLNDGSFSKIMMTPSLRMLRQKLDSVVNNKTTNKLTFISCHSSNIWPILTQFNLTSAECLTQKWNGDPVTAANCVNPPHFSSNLLVELHEEDSSLFVRVRYNGEYVSLCENKLTKCEYSNFIDRLKKLETNFETECKIPNVDHFIVEQ